MIIPIFIPHEGCPNDCAFCNQRTISGKNRAPSEEETVRIIEAHLDTMGGFADEIAFFGGSFTGIDENKQNIYLSVAQKYIAEGKVGAIRLSTRPDYITEQTVKRLKSFGVKNIELGAQSMDEEVLRLSGRGHSAEDVENAAHIITENGVSLGLQMMTGLPGDTEEKCLYTAKRFLELGAVETRIYPTVVLKGTLLAELYKEGKYLPQSVEDSVSVSAKLYRFFIQNNIKILRIGLPDSAELRENFVAGAYHPSLGELTMSRNIRNIIEETVKENTKIQIRAKKSMISKIVGNKRCNINYFLEKGVEISILQDETVENMIITAES